MAVYFFDSSALVKHYVSETGSAWVRNLCDPAANNKLFIARITGVEVISAAARRHRNNTVTSTQLSTISSQIRVDMATDFRIVDVNSNLLEQAMVLGETHALRAYDAVQLAAVEMVHNIRLNNSLPAVVLISSDIDLNAAAASIGITVDDPNMHP